jgi:hypothetical protein
MRQIRHNKTLGYDRVTIRSTRRGSSVQIRSSQPPKSLQNYDFIKEIGNSLLHVVPSNFTQFQAISDPVLGKYWGMVCESDSSPIPVIFHQGVVRG